MMLQTALLADVDWIQILIVLIFVLGPLLGQLGKKDAAKPAKPARRPARRPPQPQEAQMRKILAQANQAAERKKPRQPTPKAAAATRPADSLRPRPKPVSTISKHVTDHMLPNPVSQHAKQLGRAIDQADERVESHLHEVFDHRLGDLHQSTEADQVYQVADGTDLQLWQQSGRERQDQQLAENRRSLLDMLARPEQLRNVFVLSEVLRPPASLDE